MYRSLVVLAVVTCLAGCTDDEAVSSPAAGGMGVATGGGGGIGGAGGDGGGDGGDGGDGGAGGCVDSLPPDEAVPELLSQTGLYADILAKTTSSNVASFAPRFVLWSDDASKERWVYLPECDTIDSSNIDDWSLPVGTRLWKEFRVGGARIETRLVERIGAGPNDFVYTSYLWNEQETEAMRVPDGVVDAKGTDHDVPAEVACRRCHGSHALGGGRPSRALGFSAVQLADATPLSLADLVATNRLSDPPATTSYSVPGATAEIRDALGYMHANCGNCHNKTADRIPQVDLDLWLEWDVADVLQTGAYTTAVDVPNTGFNVPNVASRVTPGDPQASSIWFRMNERGNNAQMPPVGSEALDAAGLSAIDDWITGLR